MAYTRNESYYILDADREACLYPGLNEGVRIEEIIADLETAGKAISRLTRKNIATRFGSNPPGRIERLAE